MKNLKRELIRAKEEIKRIQSVPLVIGQFNEIIDANYGIVGQSTCSCNYRARSFRGLRLPHLKETYLSPPPSSSEGNLPATVTPIYISNP